MKKRTRDGVFVGLFVIASLVNIIGILAKSSQITFVAIPSIFISLIIMYVGSAKKTNIYFIVYLLLSLISEILFLFKESYFFYVLLASMISQVILIVFIVSFKHLDYSTAFFYFIVAAIFYIVIYKYIINAPKSFILIIAGLVNSILVAFAMVNHLRKMYLANYLLFLGVAFKVLNYAITSLDLFNAGMNVYASITDIISYFFICRSFITRVNRLPKIKRQQII